MYMYISSFLACGKTFKVTTFSTFPTFTLLLRFITAILKLWRHSEG